MKCTFWGVRGSVSAPGKKTVKYGGNTSCIELRSQSNELLILDAGTGIRQLGIQLLADNEPLNPHILLTHAHWDHLEGIPFFKPFYFKKNRATIYGFTNGKYRTKDMLLHALHQPYFPIGLSDLKADIQFRDLKEDVFEIGRIRISMILVNHPSRTVAYKFQENDKTLIFMTDNELFCPSALVTPYEKLVEFCKDADVLIHDAMYTQDEWNRYKGWGHSSVPNALQLGMDAAVSNLILFHHDPERTDKQEDIIVKECRQTVKKSKKNCHVEAATEGSTIVL